MMKILLLFFVFCTFSELVKSAKILLLYPVPSPSHGILGETFARALSSKGHEITFVSPYTMKQEYPNCKHILADGIIDKVEKFITGFQAYKKHSLFAEFTEFSEIVATMSESALESHAFKLLLKSEENYDLIILDSFFNEAHFGIVHHFKAPLILTCGANSIIVNHLTGNPAPYSFVPNLISEFSDNMSFFNRVQNSISGILSIFMHDFILFPKQEEMYNKYFPNAPSLKELADNITIILINTQPVLETPRPYMPNMIPIGGFHVQEPKQLPQDIQMYLDSATDGAIYVSLGSNLKSAELPINTINAFVNTFKKLPYKIIWKFESDNLASKPDNVMIKKWLPQQDILAHPNVKLFVSHAGLLSLTETMVRGVPVLVIPFFGDQPSNAANVVEYGYGVRLLPNKISEESLTTSILEILNNPRYATEMKYRSKAFNNLPQKPLDTAIYWVEHVLNNEGARYLHSPARKLKTYQYLLVDVIALCAVILISLISGLYFGIKFCCAGKRKEAITKGTVKKSGEKAE